MVLAFCFKVFMPPHVLYRCSVLVFLTQIRKNRFDSYKKRRSCVLSNMSIVAILIGLPVAVNNPVPTSQVVSTIPCNLTLLRRKQQQTQ